MDKVKFEEMELSKEIKKAIEDMGFEEASPIQAQTIPIILEGHDIIGQAQTGTGKTAAFGIPLIEKVEQGNKSLQAVVLCPTRELAIQVAEEIKKLSAHKKYVNVLPVYGGQPIERQFQALKKGVNIIIGTPGRVIDHINRGTIKLDGVKRVVLDEADEMFNMGFRDDIAEILGRIPEDRQTIFFSATMPDEILEFTKKYQKNPKIIKVVHKVLTVPNIEQYYYEVKDNMKTEVLCRLIDIYNPRLSLVFCNTKKRVDEITSQLQARGYSADGLHGDLKQPQRDRVMNKFRNGTIDILVATDVAARGIDVDEVDAVFNYDIPQDEEYYVHRIGRTARAGRSGRAFSFAVGRDIYKLRDIQKYAKTKISRKDIPTPGDVEERKTALLLDKIREVINDEKHLKYANLVEKLMDEYASIDIASAILKLYIGEEEKQELEKDDEEFEGTGGSGGMVRLFINVGRKDGVGPNHIVGAISGEANIPGKLIGSIDIYDKFSFVEVPKEHARDVLNAMKDNQIKGRKVNIEPANKR